MGYGVFSYRVFPFTLAMAIAYAVLETAEVSHYIFYVFM